MNRGRGIRAAAALALLAGAPSASALLRAAEYTGQDEDGPPAANVRKAEQLREIAKERNTYRNDLLVEALREVERTAEQPLGRRFHTQLATQLLLAGSTREALEVLRELAAEGEDAGLETLRATANLRLAEQENCQAHHSSDSCLLPIRGGGVHTAPEGSRAAVELFTKLLEEDPDDLNDRWLLNLATMTLGEYPDGVPERWRLPEEVFESEAEVPRFVDVARDAGVGHFALSGGVVLEDLDGDLRVDVLVSSWGTADPPRLYINRGDGTFEDRTKEAHLEGQLGGLNLSHADYDNDGWPDVFVMRGAWLGDNGRHPNSLLRNRGDGTFEDVTRAAGLHDLFPTSCAAWGDFDNDGWIDLFVGNESRSTWHPCRLFRNRGDGTFEDVSRTAGVTKDGFVKGAAWGDYDNDGRLDLYLSRFYEENVLYRNLGPVVSGSDEDGGGGTDWRFEEVTREAGVGEPRRSFPTWFFDYDNDGWLDLLVASFAGFGDTALDTVVSDLLGLDTDAERPRLYRNAGDGTFEDVTAEVGLDRVLLAMGANFGDIDNDGFLDVYFGTGDPDFRTLVPNRMFRNEGGRAFRDVSASGGFAHIQKGHGIAFGDLDNDGDQDVYAVLGGAYSGDVYPNALFLNPGGAEENRWITLVLRGEATNRLAYGARVEVVVAEPGGGTREIHRVVGTGGSFGSSTSWLEVGLGRAAAVERLEVFWPVTGERSVYEDVPLDRMVRVREGASQLEPVEPPRFRIGTSEKGD